MARQIVYISSHYDTNHLLNLIFLILTFFFSCGNFFPPRFHARKNKKIDLKMRREK